jgi:hypothetical protein
VQKLAHALEELSAAEISLLRRAAEQIEAVSATLSYD